MSANHSDCRYAIRGDRPGAGYRNPVHYESRNRNCGFCMHYNYVEQNGCDIGSFEVSCLSFDTSTTEILPVQISVYICRRATALTESKPKLTVAL